MSVDIEDLKNERFITVPNKQAPVLGTVIRAYAEKHGVPMKDAYEVESLTMAFH